ncbi:ankyrin repeat domain-containing protein 49-like [Teleopsis dalmanni]|uniref:ankyrin repeat domain-containing protein 49-like n=1 Tax=Teleopsis dalmanni TaxID=139649 RepID=UPI0018CE15C5|nr:ankyrin repeat domain-containing protein 49-like [Teleopsis dalmanni]XP_037949220.1 ankyrin repeat domain-containing protein 49-like [Teleopsis dalmanni]XP_037949221.1 ankyrin repeat domain-containing protein 49-like [Teleopsis dalmanni]
MSDYESDDEKSQFEKLKYATVPKGMSVSGWDDDEDDLVEEDSNPTATLDRYILWAVNANNIEETTKILNLDGKAVFAKDDDGYTPLHRTCYNNFIGITKLLLQYNADINAKTQLGWTPLHSACKWNNADCVSILLQHNADVNVQSEGLQTPLHIAATVSSCRSTALLLLMDVNINNDLLNNSEDTAQQIAKRSGMTYPIFEMGNPAYRVETGFIE